jgi:hypothetical protein
MWRYPNSPKILFIKGLLIPDDCVFLEQYKYTAQIRLNEDALSNMKAH